MRIAYVCCDPGIPVFGCKGCSVHVQEVLRELLRRDIKVDLFTTRLGGKPPEDLSKIHVHLIDLPSCGDAKSREIALLNANNAVRNALESNNSYDLIYERYSLCSYAAMEYANDLKMPGLLEVNSPLIDEQAQYRKLGDRNRAEQATRRVMSAAGAIIAVSKPVVDYVARYRKITDEIHVIPNGVNSNRFSVDTEFTCANKQSAFTIGFVGTLKPWHGVASLIEAFGMVSDEEPHTKLMIVGDGPERRQLEFQSAELPNNVGNRILFTGAVDPAEVPRLLKMMDVAVAPYLPKDNFYFSPLKLFEYMAAGIPTVASDIGQIPDLLENGESGLLYPPGETATLAEALLMLCRQPEIRARMGKVARKVATEKFTWESAVTKILNIANSLYSRPIPQPHYLLHETSTSKRSTY